MAKFECLSCNNLIDEEECAAEVAIEGEEISCPAYGIIFYFTLDGENGELKLEYS